MLALTHPYTRWSSHLYASNIGPHIWGGAVLNFLYQKYIFFKLLSISFFFLQPQRRRKMAFLCLSSPAGGWRVRPFLRWCLSTRPQAQSSTFCLSAPSLSPWRSLTTLNTAPSSTTPPCCLVIEELPPLTGETRCVLMEWLLRRDPAGSWSLFSGPPQDPHPWWQKRGLHCVLGRWWTGHRTDPAAEGVWCGAQRHCQHNLQEISLPRGSQGNSEFVRLQVTE